MKTELDLLVEALGRLEREHTTRNRELDARLTDLGKRLEQWALLLTSLRAQLSALTVQLERFERDTQKR